MGKKVSFAWLFLVFETKSNMLLFSATLSSGYVPWHPTTPRALGHRLRPIAVPPIQQTRTRRPFAIMPDQPTCMVVWDGKWQDESLSFGRSVPLFSLSLSVPTPVCDPPARRPSSPPCCRPPRLLEIKLKRHHLLLYSKFYSMF